MGQAAQSSRSPPACHTHTLNERIAARGEHRVAQGRLVRGLSITHTHTHTNGMGTIMSPSTKRRLWRLVLVGHTCWPCPSLYDYSVPIFWWLLSAGQCNMSQSSNPLRLVSWTWQWVHFTQMASTVTKSQSNRAPLGCGGTGDSHHGCAADKSAATVWWYHVNMDQHLWGMFPTTCWIYATKN